MYSVIAVGAVYCRRTIKGVAMCRLIEKLDQRQFTGYKVAVKKGNKYYSPAMGCEYKVGEVERVDHQRNLTTHFASDILLNCYVPEMIGRTSVFKRMRSAVWLRNILSRCLLDGASAVILKMTVTDYLMSGYYGDPWDPVVAGRRIKKIVEVSNAED